MRIVRVADLVRVPWKNGSGETAEIAVHPVGVGFADFGWRISMATVASDGPISRVYEVDRTLTILTGDGMDLTVDGQAHRLMLGSSALASLGDAPASAKLIGGLVTDLNVITRRGAFPHRVERIGPKPIEADEGGVTAIVATEPVRTGTMYLGMGDTALLDPGKQLVFADTSALLIRIELLGAKP